MAFLGCSCGAGLRVLSIKRWAATQPDQTYHVIDCLMATCRNFQGFYWPSTPSIPSLRFSQAFVDAVDADFTGIRTSSGWLMSETTQVAIFHEAIQALHYSSSSLQVWRRHKRQGKVSLERHLAEHPGELELPPFLQSWFGLHGGHDLPRTPKTGVPCPQNETKTRSTKGCATLSSPLTIL